MKFALSQAVRQGLRTLQSYTPPRRSGVAVLAYHLVEGGTGAVVDLDSETFRGQMESLVRRARVRHLAEAVDDMETGRLASGSDVVITFDDAYDNFRTVAWPILRDLALPCTLYVPVGFMEGRCPSPLAGAERIPPVSWDELATLAEHPLITVGSHSYSHVDLRAMSDAELADDLALAQDLLQRRIGVTARHFCYPQAKWSPEVERVVASVHDTAVIAGGHANTARRWNRLRISRIPLRSDMSSDLTDVVRSRVWIEEWISAKIRLRRR